MSSLVATLRHLSALLIVVAAVSIRRLVGWESVQGDPEPAVCSTEQRDRELPVRRCSPHERCVFCLSGIEEGDEVRVLGCQHLFHRCCLDRWLAARPGATCPLCRGKLLTVTATAAKRAGEEEQGPEEDERSIEGMCMVMLMAYVRNRTSVPAV